MPDPKLIQLETSFLKAGFAFDADDYEIVGVIARWDEMPRRLDTGVAGLHDPLWM